MDDIKEDQAQSQHDTKKQEVGDMIDIYKAKLFVDLGLGDAKEEERDKVLDKIEQLVNSRLINLIMIYLPEEKVSEFNQLVQKDSFTGDEINKFLHDNIPAFDDKLINELSEIRVELIKKVKVKYKTDGIK